MSTERNSAIHRRATKAQAVLSTVVVISPAEITCVGASASPVPYVQLTATVAATEQPDQQALSGTNRRHAFIPLPVYGITPRHSLILLIGGPVNISLMMIRDEDPAFFGSTRRALMFLQPAVHRSEEHTSE